MIIFLFLLQLSMEDKSQHLHKMIIQANNIGTDISPTMYGIFFEDINYGADGGLYGEKLKNRAFQFHDNFMGWTRFGNVQLYDDGPFENNPHYIRLGNPEHPQRHTGIENEGFFGIGVEEGSQYRFSVYGRCNGSKQELKVQLIKNDSMDEDQAFEDKKLVIDSTDWQKYELILTANRTEIKSHFRIFLTTDGDVDLCHFSLFPVDTFKGRVNGMRKDLAQALFDLKPGIFRFPGGCVVEGVDEKTRYQWKKTVGQLENRPLNENLWGYSTTARFFPDYFQSGGLGFYEYFQLAEDIGAEPLPVLNVGLICQARNPDDVQIPVSEVSQFVQDALDLIEFANGDCDRTKWGQLRKEMGHPKPFNLKYLAIGNEQWGIIFPERFERFITAIRKEHPEIKIVGSAGPDPEGSKFDYMWNEMRLLKPDLVDEHYYRDENWFLSRGDRYDGYDRSGPKVFAGEYACHGSGRKYNHFNASLMEAAFMTGIERNADIVRMATYAPLFAHVEGWQWRPDLIWFDSLRSVRTCSYYVQQLFSLNKGTNLIKITLDGNPVCGKAGQEGLYASSVWDASEKAFIVKVVNTGDVKQSLSLNFEGLDESVKLTNGKRTTFHSDDLLTENTLDEPYRVIPIESKISIDGHVLVTDIPAKTFEVYKFIKEE